MIGFKTKCHTNAFSFILLQLKMNITKIYIRFHPTILNFFLKAIDSFSKESHMSCSNSTAYDMYLDFYSFYTMLRRFIKVFLFWIIFFFPKNSFHTNNVFTNGDKQVLALKKIHERAWFTFWIFYPVLMENISILLPTMLAKSRFSFLGRGK